MPGIKEDTNDSEGEEMDHDSADTEKSSNDESESSGGSEDDDSSDMDEAECERRRNECIEDMADLERQFTLLREQLYKERTQQVEAKLDEVRAGHALDYLHPLEQLQQNMRIHTEVAGILKRLKIENITNKYEAERMAAKQNFESEKILLQDSIRTELEEKVKKLEEDRHTVDISSALWSEQVNVKKKNNKKSDSMTSDRRRKPVTVSGPYIVYMLRENEILEDWTIIKKAIKALRTSTEMSL